MVGLLDITKCLYEALEKLEKAHKSSKQLADALQGMQTDWSQPANPELQSYIAIVSGTPESPIDRDEEILPSPLTVLRLTANYCLFHGNR